MSDSTAYFDFFETQMKNEKFKKFFEYLLSEKMRNDTSQDKYVFSQGMLIRIVRDVGIRWNDFSEFSQNFVKIDSSYRNSLKQDKSKLDLTNIAAEYFNYLEEKEAISSDGDQFFEEEKSSSPELSFSQPVSLPPSIVMQQKENVQNMISFVPQKDPLYIAWGFALDLKEILRTKKFYPVWISGESGNGKTASVEQACAAAGRELFKIQVNEETDEDDLIGGFRLKNGETVFEDGPVLLAMKRGAVVLLDEIDRGTNKLMCIQGIMENRNYLVKKTGELIQSAPGFNIIACANTIGKGSFDGKFSGANILDEAFLERFAIVFHQNFPSVAIERKILTKKFESEGFKISDEKLFIDNLVKWANQIRREYFSNSGVTSDIISTRRLCQLASTYSIFKDRERALSLTLGRFTPESREAFMQYYKAIDPHFSNPQAVADQVPIQPEQTQFETEEEAIPF